MKNVPINNFRFGILDSIEPQSIPRGSSSRSLNWLTNGTKIELRRGMFLLGTTSNSGAGRITGLGVAKKPDGTDIIFRTRKRKVEYLDTATNDWVENGTNVLPAAVTATDSLGEDISFDPFINAQGSQMWLNSRNAGPHKIMTANPGSITPMYVAATNYKGRMRVKGLRSISWNVNNIPPNTTDVFFSKRDTKAITDYTAITAEVLGTGDASNKTFTGTLAFKAAGARRVCFQISVTDGTPVTETFSDNGDGTLTGTAGGTGTINYTSGAISVTFITAPSATANNVTVTYRWADDSSGGIADYAFSATRVAGEGFIARQALGADMQNIASLNGVEYCLHKTACWNVTIGNDDLDISNLIFRNRVGIPNHRAMVETGDGIYYIDDTDENDPHFRLLRLEAQSTEVVPVSISKQFKLADIKVGVDLSGYLFDRSAAIEFGDFVLFACRTTASATNDRVFVYNKVSKATDILDYYVSCFAIYDGTLVAGDDISDNVYTLFSGLDDLESSIGNYWESSLDNLDYNGLKRVCELTIDGDIGPEQSAIISMSVDRGDYVEVRSPSDVTNGLHAIDGTQDYIDTTQRTSIGPLTLGRGQIGGGSDGVVAYHYRRSFRIALDKFEFIKFKIEAQGLGYLSVSEFTFRDIRQKWVKVPNKYRANR